MKINIFQNSYSQPENKLTYNFLWLINYLNDSKLIEYLLDYRLKSDDQPIINISTVYGGGESNPDGSISINTIEKSHLDIYLEVKTFRRALDAYQLNGHLQYCKNNDVLLVITPRQSDLTIIDQIESSRIIFHTWQQISDFLLNNYKENTIVKEFIEYSYKSGEFESMGEIDKDEIKVITSFYKTRFQSRISSMINEIDIRNIFQKNDFQIDSIEYGNHWGREGKEIYFNKSQYGIWAFYGIYFDDSDHKIEFKELNVPEIVFFIDINPNDAKQNIDNNLEIVNGLLNLEKEGFELNVKGKLTSNRWRFIAYRKTLSDFDNISMNVLMENLSIILDKIKENRVIMSMINA